MALAAQSSSSQVADLTRQARAAAANEQWDQAVAGYRQAEKISPTDASLRIEFGSVLLQARQFTEAIASYREALRLSPRNPAAELGLARAYRGVHNYDEVRRLLERARREHPKNAEPLTVLGDLDIEMQTYDTAIGHLRAALALAPADVDARDRLALAYKARGDPTNALAQLAKVLARDPKNALAYYLRAQIYSDRKEDARALPDAQKAIELQPQNHPARILLAKILLRTAETVPGEEAIPNCSRAAEILQSVADAQPDDSETLFLLSRAYRCAGNSDAAQKTLAQFESASQRDRAAKENETQARHLVEEANSRALKNDFSGALGFLQKALEKDPNSGAAYSQLAKLYYSAGDIEKASDAISRAVALNPYQPDFLYVHGKILEKQGRLDEALAAFEQAALVNPEESDAYFEIGEIYQQRHDRARALAAYRKAVELSPGDPDYRRALAEVAGAAKSP